MRTSFLWTGKRLGRWQQQSAPEWCVEDWRTEACRLGLGCWLPTGTWPCPTLSTELLTPSQEGGGNHVLEAYSAGEALLAQGSSDLWLGRRQLTL